MTDQEKTFVAVVDLKPSVWPRQHELDVAAAAIERPSNDEAENKDRTEYSSIVKLADPSRTSSADAADSSRDYIHMRYFRAIDGTEKTVSDDIYEMQALSPNRCKPRRNEAEQAEYYGSYFVGESLVVSDGRLYVLTRVDPLFFALSALSLRDNNAKSTDGREQAKQQPKRQWEPLDQILSNVHPMVRQALCRPRKTVGGDTHDKVTTADYDLAQLKNLLEEYRLDDDMVLFRLSNQSVIQWLVKKYDRIQSKLTEQLIRCKESETDNSSGGKASSDGRSSFSASFNAPDEEKDSGEEKETDTAIMDRDETSGSISVSQAEKNGIASTALSILGDYINPEWKLELEKHLGIDKASNLAAAGVREPAADNAKVNTSKDGDKIVSDDAQEAESVSPTSAILKPPGQLPGEAEADMLRNISMGIGMDVESGERKDPTKATKTAATATSKAQTAGLKRLSKVNKKGMKSISSFFGGGPASKKQKK